MHPKLSTVRARVKGQQLGGPALYSGARASDGTGPGPRVGPGSAPGRPSGCPGIFRTLGVENLSLWNLKRITNTSFRSNMIKILYYYD